ncbi:class I SAM-dependent methyltransferase [Patescibacteria group bacterium]
MSANKKGVDCSSAEDIVKQVKNIDGWLWNNEIQAIYHFASLALKNIKPNEFLLEIGGWLGRSTITIGLACLKNNKGCLYTIDPYDNLNSLELKNMDKRTLKKAQATLYRNIYNFGLKQQIKHIKLTSRQAFKKHKHIHTRFIFIDGNHDYNEAFFDVYKWSETLVNKGYLLLHDTLNISGPRKVFYELLVNPNFAYIHSIGDVACFQKKSRLTLKDWTKKIYGYCIYKMFFKIYTPTT